MKKFLLPAFALFSALLSCKKSGPDRYITADLDGKPMNFGYDKALRGLYSGGVEQVVISGQGPAYRGDGFELMIDNRPSGKKITAGAYYDSSSDFNVTFYYTVYVGRSYEASAEVVRMADSAGIPIPHHWRVDITSIDSSTVKGTFSGDIYLTRDFSIPPIYMTNGKINTRF